MNTFRPFLLLRARVREEARAEFNAWFDAEHRRDVHGIPGIARVLGGSTPEGTRLGVYLFENAEVVQAALSSPQAAYTRGTWERWQPDLEEMSIELWTNVLATPVYESIN